jgi:hypothetical protein
MAMKTISIINRSVPRTEVYSAEGVVFGNYWGGGSGSYASKRLSGYSTEEALLKDAERKIGDGSLDSGMGYESLIGARLEITKTVVITLDGEDFVNTSTVGHFIGDLTEEQMDFLDQVAFKL